MPAGVAEVQFFLAVSQNFAQLRVVKQQPAILIDDQQRRRTELQNFAELTLVLGRFGAGQPAAVGRGQVRRRVRWHVPQPVFTKASMAPPGIRGPGCAQWAHSHVKRADSGPRRRRSWRTPSGVAADRATVTSSEPMR